MSSRHPFRMTRPGACVFAPSRTNPNRVSLCIRSRVPALKKASVVVIRDAVEQPVVNPDGRSRLLIELKALHFFTVAATFESGAKKEVDVFANLPLAMPDENEFIE